MKEPKDELGEIERRLIRIQTDIYIIMMLIALLAIMMIILGVK